MQGVSDDHSHIDDAHGDDEHLLHRTQAILDELSAVPEGQGRHQELDSLAEAKANSPGMGALLALLLWLEDLGNVAAEEVVFEGEGVNGPDVLNGLGGDHPGLGKRLPGLHGKAHIAEDIEVEPNGVQGHRGNNDQGEAPVVHDPNSHGNSNHREDLDELAEELPRGLGHEGDILGEDVLKDRGLVADLVKPRSLLANDVRKEGGPKPLGEALPRVQEGQVLGVHNQGYWRHKEGK